jgi:glutaminase
LSEFAGRPLSVNQRVFESESATNTHNKGLAELMLS